MNTTIALNKSQLVALRRQDGTVTILLQPAYLYKSEERPGLDFGTVWLQDAELVLSESLVDGAPPELPCHIREGKLSVGADSYKNLVPALPQATEPVVLHLTFDASHTLTVKGASLRIQMVDEPLFLELFKP